MTEDQMEAFNRMVATHGFEYAARELIEQGGRECAAYLKGLFAGLRMEKQPKDMKTNGDDMTPREKIQEHAKIAADKVRAAMVEFAAATGMQAQAHTSWLTISRIDSATAENICTDVTLRYEDEVRA